MFKLTNHHQSSISRLIGAVLSGHKSIQYAELDFFDGLTLIVGKNNSGKTNLLEFLYQSICFEYLPENTVLVDLHFQTTKQEMCKWRITHQVKQLNLSHNFQHRFQTQEQLLTNNKIAYEKNTTGKITDKSKISRAVPIFNRSQINNQVSYMPATTSLDAPLLTKTSSIVIKHGKKIEHDSLENTPIFIRYFIRGVINELLSHKSLFELKDAALVNDFIRNYIPLELRNKLQFFSPITDVRISPDLHVYFAREELIINNLFFEVRVNNEWQPWHYLSNGLRRLFLIIANVFSQQQGVFLIDEPELGLGESEIELLGRFFNEQVATKQIIVSTHSNTLFNAVAHEYKNNLLLCKYIKGKGSCYNYIDTTEVFINTNVKSIYTTS